MEGVGRRRTDRASRLDAGVWPRIPVFVRIPVLVIPASPEGKRAQVSALECRSKAAALVPARADAPRVAGACPQDASMQVASMPFSFQGQGFWVRLARSPGPTALPREPGTTALARGDRTDPVPARRGGVGRVGVGRVGVERVGLERACGAGTLRPPTHTRKRPLLPSRSRVCAFCMLPRISSVLPTYAIALSASKCVCGGAYVRSLCVAYVRSLGIASLPQA